MSEKLEVKFTASGRQKSEVSYTRNKTSATGLGSVANQAPSINNILIFKGRKIVLDAIVSFLNDKHEKSKYVLVAIKS